MKLEEYEDLVKFIKDNNIDSRVTLRKYKRYYNKFRQLSEEDKERLLPRKIKFNNYTDINSKEDLEKFIKDNNITFRSQLESKAKELFFNLSKEEQDKILPFKKKKHSDLRNYDDFKEFIESNNIKTRQDLVNRFGTYYAKLFRKNLTQEEQDELLPPMFKIRDTDNLPITFEDFSIYLKQKCITTRVDLIHHDIRIYRRFKQLSKEEKNILLPTKNFDIEGFNTIADYQEYIDDNKIISYQDLKQLDKSLYFRLFNRFSSDERDLLVFLETSDGKSHSYGESFIVDLLNKNNISYETEKTFPELKIVSSLRFDFYLPNLNTIIEYHGAQHFDRNNNFYSINLENNDKIKYDYCISNKINIIYFTFEIKAYKKWGYFTEVITDVEALLKRLNEIGSTNQFTI